MPLEVDAKSTDSSIVETGVTTGAPATDQGQVQNGQAKDVKPETAVSDSSAEKDSGAKGPSTALEAAKAALGMSGTAADSPSADKGTEKQAEPGTEADKASAIDKAIADKTLPFHTHPRWKEVGAAAKALETQAKTLEGQVGDLTPKAQKWDALDAKFAETGLAPEDVEPLFEGGAMLKRAGVLPQEQQALYKVGAALKLGDREVVRQLASPVFEALGLTLVEVMPKDIQDRIEQGALTEDDGRRLASVEFDARRERALRERAESRVQERDNADNAGRQEKRFTAAAAAWEARVKPTDADWSSKEDHVVKAIEEMMAVRPPQSEKEVVEYCQRAHDQVTRIMRAAKPVTRPSVQPARSGSSTATTPVPKSSLEAARLALRPQG